MKRRNTESEPKGSPAKKRRENWSTSDDLNLLKLVNKYQFAWDQVKHDFTKLQHRQTEEDETSLEKYVHSFFACLVSWEKAALTHMHHYTRVLVLHVKVPSLGCLDMSHYYQKVEKPQRKSV